MSDDFSPGSQFRREIPVGDNRERHVCGDCGHIHYVNPKVVVGAVCHWQERILLCRRAIEPRKGYWTHPAGFMEEQETTREGAAREAWEEARARLRLGPLLALYNIPKISQVQLFYVAELIDGSYGVGEESLEVELFRWQEIPWDELAFPTVRWALEAYRQVGDRTDFAPFTEAPLG